MVESINTSHLLISTPIPKEVIPSFSREENLLGCLFVISAPAGAGKTSLVQELVSYFPSLTVSITYTTRPPRAGEKNGIDYHFISRESFIEKVSKKEFLEWIEIHGNFYGSLLSDIENTRQKGQHVIMVIDTDGARKVQNLLNPVMIFIRPPSMAILKERLIGRRSESKEIIEKRLEKAIHEMACIEMYQYSIINDIFSVALMSLVCIIASEVQKKNHIYYLDTIL